MVAELHQLFAELPRHTFPLSPDSHIPKNGIYILFEQGERYGVHDRIVRVGTHTGENQLPSRLKKHFINENKNFSIFRKNIGRALLNKESHPYSPLWELKVTSRADREKNLPMLDLEFEKSLERRISTFIRDNFSFCTFAVETKEERLRWESKIVSTVAQADNIKLSADWLGHHSPKDRIRISGLWQVNELYNEPLAPAEWVLLKNIVNGGQL